MTKRQDRSSEEYVQRLSEVEGMPADIIAGLLDIPTALAKKSLTQLANMGIIRREYFDECQCLLYYRLPKPTNA